MRKEDLPSESPTWNKSSVFFWTLLTTCLFLVSALLGRDDNPGSVPLEASQHFQAPFGPHRFTLILLGCASKLELKILYIQERSEYISVYDAKKGVWISQTGKCC